jgi:hypothetical protein
VNDELGRRLGLPPRPSILVELGGNAAAVAAQRDALGKIAPAEEIPGNVWEKMRATAVSDDMVVRISGLPATLAERWDRARAIGEDDQRVMMHASIGRGTARCILTGEPPAATVDRLSAPHEDDTLIFENLPQALWAKLAASAIADRVSQGVRKAFDPLSILNPGILGAIN